MTRPRIGISSLSTSGNTPACCSARIPRADSARLIERPATGGAMRGSARRSSSETSNPCRLSKTASRLPQSPAPMMVTDLWPASVSASGPCGFYCRIQALDEIERVCKAVVQRRQTYPDHVRLAPVRKHILLRQPVEHFPGVHSSLHRQRQLRPASVLRRDAPDADSEPVLQQAREVLRQAQRFLTQADDACLVENLKRCQDGRERQYRGIAQLPQLGPFGRFEFGCHVEARFLRVAPPAEKLLRGIAVKMPRMHECTANCARSAVQVLVAAPGREIRAPVVQGEGHVSHRVREVESYAAAFCACTSRKVLHVEELAVVVLHTR